MKIDQNRTEDQGLPPTGRKAGKRKTGIRKACVREADIRKVGIRETVIRKFGIREAVIRKARVRKAGIREVGRVAAVVLLGLLLAGCGSTGTETKETSILTGGSPENTGSVTSSEAGYGASGSGSSVRMEDGTSGSGSSVRMEDGTSGSGSSVRMEDGTSGSGSPAGTGTPVTDLSDTPDWNRMEQTGRLSLSYADQFSVTYYGDYKWLSVVGTGEYLLVPESGKVPDNLPEGTVVLQAPLDHVYLTATSAMDFFRRLDGLKTIGFSGTKETDWYLEEAKEAMRSGTILYAGKYSAPDYELLLEGGCDVAVESTMICHCPKVREQLERLGIPVLVEHSSYEGHPLGRMEWIKFYGALLGREDAAEQFFADELARLQPLMEQKQTGQTVAFFAIDTSGRVTVRKSGDYIARLIELAGGQYVPENENGDGDMLSTVKIQMEAFYEVARDADVLIYNSTIEGELRDLDELLDREPLLAGFSAFRTGRVFCTGKNLFQESTAVGALLEDVHRVLTEETGDEKLTFLYRLK